MQRAKIEELRTDEEVRAFEEEEEEEAENGEAWPEDEDEMTIREWLVEEVWNDTATMHSLWNVGKAVVLFGLTVWALRRYPSFMDPEPWTPEMINFRNQIPPGAYPM